MSSPGSQKPPERITYYSAEEDKEIDVSPEFISELQEYDTQTKVDAVRWIAQGGANAKAAVDDYDYLGESFNGDAVADESLNDPVLTPVKQYDQFRGKFVGKPQSPELSAFLDSSQTGLQKILDIRDSLQYRSNANNWLRGRVVSGSSRDQAASTALTPQMPPAPSAAAKVKPGSLPHNRENLERLIPYAQKWAGAFGIPTTLVLAIMKNESSFQPWVINPKAKSLQGAYGCMQMTLKTAINSIGFVGNPIPWVTKSEATFLTKPDGSPLVDPKYGPLYLPPGGAEIYRLSQSGALKSAWLGGAGSGDDNMGRNPEVGSDIIHPETNIMLGAKYLAYLLDLAASSGVFLASGQATTSSVAQRQNLPISSGVGLTGVQALNWTMQMYNGSPNRIGYADSGLKNMATLEKALDDGDKKPPSAKQNEVAAAQFQSSTKGKGRARQLSSFSVAFLDSLRVV